MKRVAVSGVPDRVAIVGCGAYEEKQVDFAVNEALELLGGWEKFTGSGQSTYVKPNLAGPFSPESAVTTHPLVVKSVAEALCIRKMRPTIGDSPAGLANRNYLKLTYKRTGMESVSKQLDVPLDYNAGALEMPLPHGRVMKRFTLLQSLVLSGNVINLPKFKTHLFTRMTGAVKNLYGAVHGVMKMAYHSRYKDSEAFSGMLLDLVSLVRPELTVMDAVVGMEGDGPTWGKPRFVGYIIAGTNPLAVDLVMCRMMGFSPEQVPLFRITAPPFLEVVGVPLEEALVDGFKKPRRTDVRDGLDALRWIPERWRDRFGRELMHRPIVKEMVCTGCGRCVKSCPESVIGMKNQKAEMDHHRCIRCWCCHEVCPSGAVELAQSLLGRLLTPLGG
ncbi:MAG: DUF362 domain-containing protein [Deltaproteobacteria bacterium]|nr:DUF362 domain-containing protein [Deltaproteobacteria bacterium]